MAQKISQFYNILIGLIKNGGKQVAQVVGKYLGWLHPGSFAQPFHFRPDSAAVQAFPVIGEKNFAGDGFLLSGIFEQFPAQLGRQQDGPVLPFK